MEQVISTKKKQTCSRSGCVFWSDYPFLIFKDGLLNALFLFNKCAIECFQNVFFVALFIVTFLLFNSCFFQHKPNLFMKLHYLTWNCWLQFHLSLIIWYSVFTPLCYNSYYAINGNMLFFVFYVSLYIFYNFSIRWIWQSQKNT